MSPSCERVGLQTRLLHRYVPFRLLQPFARDNFVFVKFLDPLQFFFGSFQL